jgi:hypothetical protein
MLRQVRPGEAWLVQLSPCWVRLRQFRSVTNMLGRVTSAYIRLVQFRGGYVRLVR